MRIPLKISRYPLYELSSNIVPPVQIAKGVSIIANNIDINRINEINVSKEDARHLTETQLCLQIDENVIPPKEASIAFIISCRLLKRTKVFIRYRGDSLNQLIKIRDDYPFVTASNATETIKKKEFEKIAKLYAGLDKFKNLNKRTGNAVYFLGLAYRAGGWLESLIFHVCALETLTSASNRENRITQKFRERIHNFIGYNENKLGKIYNIRSELVHGRYSHKSVKVNLRLNRIAESACRQMFIKILLNPIWLNAFKCNRSRMELFGNNKSIPCRAQLSEHGEVV